MTSPARAPTAPTAAAPREAAAATAVAAAAAVLFACGVACSHLFTLLHDQQQQRLQLSGGAAAATANGSSSPGDALADLGVAWTYGLGAASGLGAVIVGAVFPMVDRAFYSPPHITAADCVRCIGFFFGMNYAASVRWRPRRAIGVAPK